MCLNNSESRSKIISSGYKVDNGRQLVSMKADVTVGLFFSYRKIQGHLAEWNLHEMSTEIYTVSA